MIRNQKSLADGIEFGGVEFLVEIGSTFVRETIETTRDTLYEAVPRQLREPVTRMTRNRPTEILDSLRSKVPLLPEQLKDSVVTWNHPFRRLSHRTRTIHCQTHSGIGYLTILEVTP